MPKQLRMAHKLWLAVILIVVMLVAVVGFAAYRSAKVQAQADAVSKDMEARVQAALRWSGLTETNAARTQALIVSNDPAVEAEFKDVIAATSAQISEVQKSLESMALSDADKAQMNKIAAARKTMIDLRGEARKLKSDGQQDQAVTLINQKYNPSVAAYLAALREFVAQLQKNAAETQVAMAAERMLTVKIAAVAVGLLLLAIIVGAYYLIGSIQRPLAQANGLADHLAREVSMFKVNAASYGPAQAAIGVARGAAKATTTMPATRNKPAASATAGGAPAARISTASAPAAPAKSPSSSAGVKQGAKHGATAGAEEDWESF
eukprot:gene4640-4686_t